MRDRYVYRRLLTLACAPAVVAALLVGCGSSSPTSGAVKTPHKSSGIANAVKQVKLLESNQPIKLAALPKRPPKGIYVAEVNCTIPACGLGILNEPAKLLGWKLKVFNYDNTVGPSSFVSAVKEAIASNPKALVIDMNFPETLIASEVASATKSGIKVIDVGGKAIPKPANYVACIQCTPPLLALGRVMADVALANAGKPTTMVALYDKTIQPLDVIVTGAEKEVASNGDGSKVLTLNLPLANPPSQNAASVVAFLQRNTSVKYVLVTTPANLPGLHDALSSAGLINRVKLIGSSPSNSAQLFLVKSQLLAWVAGDASLHQVFWWRAMDAAVRAVEGVKVTPFAPVDPTRVITAKNVSLSIADPLNWRKTFLTAWHLR